MSPAFHVYLLDKTNSRFARRLQQSVPRRLIVACGAAWLMVMALSFSSAVNTLWILALIDIPFIGLATMLVLSVYGIFELPDDKLDEHQLAVRNRAYKAAYGFSLIYLLVMMVVIFGLSLSKLHAFSVVLMSFLAIALAPRAIAAWTLESRNTDEEHS